MIFDVHLFAVVRVKVTGVEADSASEAAAKADKSVEPCAIFDEALNAASADVVGWRDRLPGAKIEYVEFADEIVDYLVDEQGDEEFLNSRWFGPDLEPRPFVIACGSAEEER